MPFIIFLSFLNPFLSLFFFLLLLNKGKLIFISPFFFPSLSSLDTLLDYGGNEVFNFVGDKINFELFYVDDKESDVDREKSIYVNFELFILGLFQLGIKFVINLVIFLLIFFLC